MVKPARRLIKLLIFIGLCILSLKFVHTYPYPMPENQLAVWFKISECLGVSDPKNVYFPVVLVIDLIVAVIAYKLIVRLWRI